MPAWWSFQSPRRPQLEPPRGDVAAGLQRPRLVEAGAAVREHAGRDVAHDRVVEAEAPVLGPGHRELPEHVEGVRGTGWGTACPLSS